MKRVPSGWFIPFFRACAALGILTQMGVFGAGILAEIENDGPVTIVMDKG